MKVLWLSLAVSLLSTPFPSLSFPSPATAAVQRSPCAVSVVLVGSTGDLARRYLWPAIFHNYMQMECLPDTVRNNSRVCGLLVMGGSREAVKEDEDSMLRDLLSRVHCHTLSCELCLEKFIVSSLMVKIGREEDYKAVSKTLSDTYQRLNLTEVGRAFYLSVPPSAYGSIVRYIDLYGRPAEGSWLRVVLEKPFGSDLSSAKLLTDEVRESLAKEEVYRVDHYLGKLGVQQIYAFRRANSVTLQSLWNKAHVQHVHVAVKERLDVKGRSGFFDRYGIVRDMHQNHLTEVLTRLLMSIPSGSAIDFHGRKIQFLSRLYHPSLHHTILGQYEAYQAHLAQDGVMNLNSSTSTYATVALYSRDPRWTGVPFLLTAGKQLGKREAYARVVFKQWKFSLVDSTPLFCPVEIVFLIQDEVFRRPGVLVSQHFSGMDLKHDGLEWSQRDVRLGNCSYSFLSPVQETADNAYIPLVADILLGRKEAFVDTEALLASWEVWDPLLNDIKAAGKDLTVYQYSLQDLSALDFHINGSKLISEADSISLRDAGAFTTPCEKNSTRLGFPFVIGTKERVYSCLARDLYQLALGSASERGVFHLALPGGQSPRPLLDMLSLEYAHTFPWQHTHIWQTDERCVKRNHSDSNWYQIDELLLSHVHIPFHQLHPMPVELQNGLCAAVDGGCGLYESYMQNNIGTPLDHVVLGVGRDGHVASLFPSHDVAPPQPPSNSEHVQLVQLDPTAPVRVKERMTLTYSTILSARAVSVVIAGAGKEQVVGTLLSGARDGPATPLQRLLEGSRRDQVTLYIAT